MAAYRGVTALGALGLQAEVCDWHRFGRPAQVMGFVGLVPTEYSSGGSTRRGHITKAGNVHLRTQLVESAWAYQYRPYVGTQIAQRQQGLAPEVIARSWAASCACAGAFVTSPPARTTRALSPLPLPGSSPASCGRR
ncbi:MAG: transposase [Acidimicrobiales bacterium]